MNIYDLLKTNEVAVQPLELLTHKYLVFSNLEEGKDLSKLSSFLINMAITGRVGSVASIRNIQNGTFLIETSGQNQSLSLFKMTTFFNQVKVSMEPHRSSNYSKGLVVYRKHITMEEIKIKLSKQCVINVTRIM